MSKTQRDEGLEKIKRIFYTNITYGCNSNCVFCYSHNTKHIKDTYNEVSKESLVEYWNRMCVTKNDRIIINGGEPLLHTEFKDILAATQKYGCEVLIYTNGRLLSTLDTSILISNYRFVVPIHGHEELHDNITRVRGSYQEMIEGVNRLASSKALVDLKVIINNQMAIYREKYLKTLDSLCQLPDINAVHITKMADTILSQRNQCPSVIPEMSSRCTKGLFDYFKNKCVVKLFDTCIREIVSDNSIVVNELGQEIKVFFKDAQHEFALNLEKPYLRCMDTCKYKDICQSAVGEYTVLEVNDNSFSIGLE